MTKLLEKALNEAAKLPSAEQNALVRAMFAELASEHRWHRLFDFQDELPTESA